MAEEDGALIVVNEDIDTAAHRILEDLGLSSPTN